MTEPARKLTPSEFLAELKRQVAETPLPDNGPPAAEFADLDFSDLADLPPGPNGTGAPGGLGNGAATATQSPPRAKATPRQQRSAPTSAPSRIEPQRHRSRRPAESDPVDSSESNGKHERNGDSRRSEEIDRAGVDRDVPVDHAPSKEPAKTPVDEPPEARKEAPVEEAVEETPAVPEAASETTVEEVAADAPTADEPLHDEAIAEETLDDDETAPGASGDAIDDKHVADESPHDETPHDEHSDHDASTDAATDDESAEELSDNLRDNPHLFALFDRVNRLLGGEIQAGDEHFRPRAVESLYETGMTAEEIERIVLKFLLSRGEATGRQVAAQICLPFQIVDPLLKQLKQEQIVAFSGAAEMGDYEFVITERGRERARAYSQECTYFGACPVALRDYLRAMEAQSVGKQQATEEDLREAFSELIVPHELLDRLGPAINSGRGMFLFGEPGNGKTSIAERITRCFGSTIWIPKALGIDGDIIRLYDPGVHEAIEDDSHEGIFDLSGVDQRWVRIVRPTVIAGGELTMSELEVTQNKQTKICEAPLQLKSNCGTLVIDDFGRQTMPTDMLLNRWIVPLEKRFDYLNLPSGKKVQVPFDQLIIFSTNLEPKDLVDDAFLRRIPYKIEVPNPDRAQFVALFERMSPLMGFQYDAEAVAYLIDTHYEGAGRSFRACQPRDLLLQVKNYCTYKGLPRKLSPHAFDQAVENYFSVM